MPFDRDATLRKAEKLLRQGKLDLAIAEYRSVIEAEPSDWNTANTLGDLYIRAKQTDKAVAEYSRIADHLANEGFVPKAVALYKKILKIKPDEERAMWHLGTIAARQGLLVDARAQFSTLAERRRGRGDRRGEAEARIQLGDLDGADLQTRLTGARARLELGQQEQAVEAFKKIAADLEEKGKTAESLKVIEEAAALASQDVDLKRTLMNAYAARGDFEGARKYASNPAELLAVADELFKQGREDDGLGVLVAALQADPSDAALGIRLAKLYLARGDHDKVKEVLTPEVAGADPNLLAALAEMELRAGRVPQGISVLQQLLASNPDKRDDLVILGCSIGEINVDAGYECIEVVARAAIASDEWGSAAAALNEFVQRFPNHIPALMHLVEICVDGGLEATMHSAQAQLADAYLVTGGAAEARVIAEDLVAREPWDRSNIERFRQALTMLGEKDIDAIIADRLSGQSPFVSTDMMWPTAPAAPPPPAATQAAPAPPAQPPAAATAGKRSTPASHAIDVSGIFAGGASEEHAEPVAERKEPAAEVDLSSALGKTNLESVLKGVREEAIHDAASPEVGEQHFKLATNYLDMDMTSEAISALEVAARSLRHRFRAGALLAKLYADKGDKARAIEWFERAAEAPAPTPEASYQLLYELAALLEAEGESTRALAVLLELQSEAGEYRDVAARLEHLMGS